MITTSLVLDHHAACPGSRFYQVGIEGHETRIELFRFIDSGALQTSWALRIDTLTAVMLVVVTTVSGLVHLYSIGYMEEDPHRPRFFAYLSLFTFAMLALVTADNFVQLFFGWEGVGLMSYLLIGFWYHRPSANAAAIKAFIVNRVGDFGFALGIFATFTVFNTVQYDTVFASAPDQVGKTMEFLGMQVDALTLICLLAVHRRHGQVGAIPAAHLAAGRHGGPDTGLGPDPCRDHGHRRRVHGGAALAAVRACPDRARRRHLLRRHHRLLCRHGGPRAERHQAGRRLFDLLAARLHVRGRGRRRTTAPACSISSPMPSSRRCCSLGAGAVIHALHHEQDMRRMGALRKVLPFTWAMMLIGTLSLTGFPFTSGFVSKDAIIEAAYAAGTPIGMYGFVLTAIAALLTSFYSWRLMFLTFEGKPREKPEVLEHAHEPPWTMGLPLDPARTRLSARRRHVHALLHRRETKSRSGAARS